MINIKEFNRNVIKKRTFLDSIKPLDKPLIKMTKREKKNMSYDAVKDRPEFKEKMSRYMKEYRQKPGVKERRKGEQRRYRTKNKGVTK